MLGNALIFPHIFYCLAVVQGVGSVLDGQLQRMINRAVRFVTGLPRDASISGPRRDLGWLTISDYRMLAMGTLMYRVLGSGSPAYLAELFAAYTSTQPRRQVQAQQALVVPSFRTECYRAALAMAGPVIWNGIPVSIRDQSSPAAFKTNLRGWLMQRESQRAS
ncbi:uncharacterized protein LOC107046695 [Diachasma alloeum]|uniref:uncharacterized protein LOC107046695 n=1 Tax=Diachasma alloeum TaxID=454923 RepID=UPI0007382CAD|nr:uncharacterized protein LOC107046695 [Diachasma alloeum]